MPVRLRCLLAAPLVVLLGAAMALATWPDGDVTSRDRELVARLTRGGVQRLDADGGHVTADAVDVADVGTSAAVPDGVPDVLAVVPAPGVAAPSMSTWLVTPAVHLAAGRRGAPPGRDRAPPQS